MTHSFPTRRSSDLVEEVGSSAEGRPLRHVSWGDGHTRVLLWSQMHGDESTASMAIADLFRFLGEHPDHPLVQRLREGTTLHFLPVMNPDGAARIQRRNAQGDRKGTRLNSSHYCASRMPSPARNTTAAPQQKQNTT